MFKNKTRNYKVFQNLSKFHTLIVIIHFQNFIVLPKNRSSKLLTNFSNKEINFEDF
jgi:hypothetical protein